MKAKRSVRKRLPVVLDQSEVERVLKVPNIKCPTGLRNRAVLELMAGGGLRVSEVVQLKPSGIRWDSGIIEVHNGKGGRDRNVPVTSDTLGWLQAWGNRRPQGKRFFCTLHGTPLSTRYLQAAVKRIARRAGIENAERVSPHTLRHTYATRMLDQGFTIREVQELLGHSSVSTTMIYTHVRPKELASKIQKGVFVTNAAAPDWSDLARKLQALPDEARRLLVQVLSMPKKGTP
jgi:site-specific recombinase XerD